MKRVLVTGGALGDVPIIKFLKQEGHFVITTGSNPNDIGHTYSDKYVACDYTDSESLVELFVRWHCDAIIPSAHDLAAIAAARVAQKLVLPGFDSPAVSMMIHNKDRLRQALELCGIPQPKFWLLGSELDLLSQTSWKFPLIVKPIDLTGGTGISISRDLYSLRVAFGRAQSASPSGQVIVEEFLHGSYHGLTTIIHNQQVVFLLADNEFFLFDAFRVSATTTPANLSQNIVQDVSRMLSYFAKKHNLVDGLLHVQLVLSKGKAYILEICRRTPGDLYPYFVELTTSQPYIKWIISPFLGQKYLEGEIQSAPRTSSNVARFMLMPGGRGTFSGIEDAFQKNYELVFPVLAIGSYIEKPRKETIAIYFLRDSSLIGAETLQRMKDLITPKVVLDENVN